MIEKNQVLDVDIVDNGIDGEGIAKVDGFTVFVPGAIADERVRIKLLKVLSSHGYAKVLDILESSEFRRSSDCATFDKCGGCSMRHMDYKKVLDIKKRNVENTLKKQGIDVKVNDIIGMESPFFYRNLYE